MSKRPADENNCVGTVSKYFRTDSPARRLGPPFFQQNCVALAKRLLGRILCRRIGSQVLRGRIVETESYLGVTDGVSHSYRGRRTDRNAAMFMEPGTVYVYPIYGMYECVNISSQEEGSAVLIRAIGRDLNVAFNSHQYALCIRVFQYVPVPSRYWYMQYLHGYFHTVPTYIISKILRFFMVL